MWRYVSSAGAHVLALATVLTLFGGQALAQGVSFMAARAFPLDIAGTYVATGDFNHDGILDVAVAGQNISGGAVLLGLGDGNFRKTAILSPDGAPSGIAVGDLNGDGFDDCVVIHDFGKVSVFLSNGDGTFQVPLTFDLSFIPQSLALADLNGDGKLDVVAAGSPFAGNIAVLLGNGDGTLQPASYYVAAGDTLLSLVIGDFNADGNLDVATASAGFSGGFVSVLLGNGDGSLGAARSYTVGAVPRSIVSGDFNDDGALDLAVATMQSGEVSVLLGNGDGTFRGPLNLAFGQEPLSLAAADFDGDGKVDLLVGAQSPSRISLLRGNGDGSFEAGPNLSLDWALSPNALLLGDFNSDGRLDVLSGAGGGIVRLVELFGLGDGTFQTAPTQALANFPDGAAAGDFNGDGRADMALLTFSQLDVLISRGDGTFDPPRNIPGPFSSGPIVTADLNGDGFLDLVVPSNFSGNVEVLLGNGDGTFQPSQRFPANVAVRDIVVGDLNGDGKLDLIVLDVGGRSGSALIGNGDGTFQTGRIFTTTGNNTAVTIGDFDGDGNGDLALTSATAIGPVILVLIGNGDGTFRMGNAYPVGRSPIAVATADFNGDGFLDLVVANRDSASLNVLINNGDGTFQAAFNFPGIGNPQSPRSLLVADFDGDGRTDVAVAATSSGVVSVLLNNTGRIAREGDPSARTIVSFLPPELFGAGPAPNILATGDFDGSGRTSLAAVSRVPSSVSVLINNTSQSQVTQSLGGMETGPSWIQQFK